MTWGGAAIWASFRSPATPCTSALRLLPANSLRQSLRKPPPRDNREPSALMLSASAFVPADKTPAGPADLHDRDGRANVPSVIPPGLVNLKLYQTLDECDGMLPESGLPRARCARISSRFHSLVVPEKTGVHRHSRAAQHIPCRL